MGNFWIFFCMCGIRGFRYVNFDAIWIGTGFIDFGHFHNARTNMVDNFRIKTILVPIES